MKQPPVHPAADLFPMMEADELDKLAADIKANGQRQPIVLMLETGQLIDGRNRLKACELAGVEPRTSHWSPAEGQSVVSYVLSLNLHRRHLDSSQRATIAARVANMKEGRPRKDTPSKDGVSQAEAAKLLNVSEKSVERAAAVLASGNAELIAAVEKGDMSVSAAAAAAKRPANQRPVTTTGNTTVAKKPLPRVTLDAPPDPHDGRPARGSHEDAHVMLEILRQSTRAVVAIQNHRPTKADRLSVGEACRALISKLQGILKTVEQEI